MPCTGVPAPLAGARACISCRRGNCLARTCRPEPRQAGPDLFRSLLAPVFAAFHGEVGRALDFMQLARIPFGRVKP